MSHSYTSGQISVCLRANPPIDISKKLNLSNGEYVLTDVVGKIPKGLTSWLNDVIIIVVDGYVEKYGWTSIPNKGVGVITTWSNFDPFVEMMSLLYKACGYQAGKATNGGGNSLAGTVAVEVDFNFDHPLVSDLLPEVEEEARSVIRRTWREWPWGLALHPKYDYNNNKIQMIWINI